MTEHRPIPSGAPSLELSYSELWLSDGMTAAVWTRESHGDEGQATSAPPGVSVAPEREERPCCAGCAEHTRVGRGESDARNTRSAH